MTHHPWRRAKFIVEVPVSGPMSDRQLRGFVETHLHSLHSRVPSFQQVGRPRVKSLGRVLSAVRSIAKKEALRHD